MIKSKNNKIKSKKTSICWHCKNATGGCKWSNDGKPVEQWVAKKTKINNGFYGITESFLVEKCPLFERGINHFSQFKKNVQM
ncbi:MAG: hypothetical protein RR549_02750 [Oscillospiraceae bacterium]